MKEQNFKNHSQLVFPYHVVTGLALLALLTGSIINAANSSEDNFYSATLLVLASVLLLVIAFFARSFALKAQDRAIRAEESLRHFILTGKQLDSRLTVQQIIALRFASDAEFIPLTQRAVAENMTNREIKKAIQNWRPDFHRV